jgi:hypothetical protein
MGYGLWIEHCLWMLSLFRRNFCLVVVVQNALPPSVKISWLGNCIPNRSYPSSSHHYLLLFFNKCDQWMCNSYFKTLIFSSPLNNAAKGQLHHPKLAPDNMSGLYAPLVDQHPLHSHLQ